MVSAKRDIRTICFLLLGSIIGFTVVGLFDADSISRLASNKKSVSLLTINGIRFSVEKVVSPAQRIKGLSGRKKLAEDHGMLFVYPSDGYYSFWMKDMNFPIDIIWIDSHKRIVDIAAKIYPETYPQTFTSRSAARYILEVNAGTTDRYSIQHGDEIVW